MLIISLAEKGGDTKQLQFDQTELTIGRVQGNEIVLAKGNVSKRHCRIASEHGKFIVEDLKSTNGTYVNGRKIAEAIQIYQGDKVYIGDFIIRVENAPSPEAANLGEEAGSLSSALGNRRGTGGAPSRSGAKSTDPGPAAPPPPSPAARTMPPPPPPRRDTMVPAPPEAAAAPPPPPKAPQPATDLDLDDEPLATRPPRAAAPPPAAAPALAPESQDALPIADSSAPSRPPGRTGRASSDIPTGNRKGSAVALAQINNPADPSGWVRHLLADHTIGAISVVGVESVTIERGGKQETVTLGETEMANMAKTLRALATAGGAPANATTVEVRIQDDALLAAIFPPATTQICASIRRAPAASHTLHDLAEAGAMSSDMREVIEACVNTRRNIILAGDPNATQMVLDGLTHAIPSSMRVVALGGRVRAADPGQAWAEVALDKDAAATVRAAVAVRPDLLIVDVTGADVAAEIVRACGLGLQGVLVCVGGRSAQEGLERLSLLATAAMPGDGARKLTSVGFEAIAHAATLPDGKLRIFEIAETTAEGDASRTLPLLAFKEGKFQRVGKSTRLGPTLARLGRAVGALA